MLLDKTIENAVAVNLSSLGYIWPEVVLTASIMIIIVVDLIVGGGKKGLMTAMTLASLVICLIAVADLYDEAPRSLFLGMAALDGFALFFKILFVVTTILVVLFGLQSPDIEEARIGEFYAIFLSVVLGGFFMASATNLLMMYLALELVSLPVLLSLSAIKSGCSARTKQPSSTSSMGESPPGLCCSGFL